MDLSEQELHLQFMTGKISEEEFRRISNENFLKQFPPNSAADENYPISLIQKAVGEKDAELLEKGFLLMLIQEDLHGFPIRTEILCGLLQEDWHYKHEDIARNLQAAKDPQTIECLYQAAELHFKYLDYDDTYQFARKCIKALSAINTDAAVDKLKLLAQSKNEIIRQYAVKELGYKGLL